MLYSQFFVGDDRYVISAKDIVEIVPFVTLKSTPKLPDYSAGLMNYRGDSVLVIDVCHLLIKRPCRKRLSTRIIIVNKESDNSGPMMLGFLVEKATEMISIDEGLFKPQLLKNPDTPTNGPVAVCQEYLVEKISIEDVYNKLDKRFFNGIVNSVGEMT